MSEQSEEELPTFVGSVSLHSNDIEEEEDVAVADKATVNIPDPSSGSQSAAVRGSGNTSRLGKRKTPARSTAAATDGADDDGGNDHPFKLISEIWKHYKVKAVDGKRVATCIYCNTTVKAEQVKNTTSSARNHYLKCKMNPANIRYDQTCINFPPAGSTEVLPGSYKWQYDAKQLMDVIVDKFIIDETCFSEIDKPGFRKMCKVGFHPSFTLPSRHTLARKVMDRHEDLRGALKKFFAKKSQRVSLTSDCWTSSGNHNFLSLTAHFVDDNFVLQKKILSFVAIESHRGEDMAYVIEKCLREWGIEKVFCITLDNASANDVMARTLRDTLNEWGHSMLGGELMHMRCAAHIVNLVVTEGLKENQEAVQKVRACVGYMRRSYGRWKKLRECAALEKLTYKKHLWLDSPTRWNGAYIMLDRAVQYRKAFDRYAKIEKSFKNDMVANGGIPTREDWESVERLVKFLEHFHMLTKKISGSWYVTTNMALPEISDLYTKMKKLEVDVDPSIVTMAKRMIGKFDKYWGSPEKLNNVICFAYVLDPRCKLEFLKFTLCNLFGPVRGKMYVECVKQEMGRLYSAYEMAHPCASSSVSSSFSPYTSISGTAAGSGSGCGQEEDDDLLMTVEEFTRRRMIGAGSAQGRKKTELDKYLAEEVDPYSSKFEVLLWWKVNAARFPILSAMAKDVLAVPISTVASESAFSTSGRVLSDFRSSLNDETVEALICAQDWIYPRGAPPPPDEVDVLDFLAQLEEEIHEKSFSLA